jgi:hypothetical protein
MEKAQNMVIAIFADMLRQLNTIWLNPEGQCYVNVIHVCYMQVIVVNMPRVADSKKSVFTVKYN